MRLITITLLSAGCVVPSAVVDVADPVDLVFQVDCTDEVETSAYAIIALEEEPAFQDVVDQIDDIWVERVSGRISAVGAENTATLFTGGVLFGELDGPGAVGPFFLDDPPGSGLPVEVDATFDVPVDDSILAWYEGNETHPVLVAGDVDAAPCDFEVTATLHLVYRVGGE